jgi:hypothetical protein
MSSWCTSVLHTLCRLRREFRHFTLQEFDHTGLIETWWISHLGAAALAGMAGMFPVLMLM